METIYSYQDYRRYLSDYYTHKKQLNKSFSFRFLAKKAQLKSPNYFKLIMDGKRNLTHKNIHKFSKALNLNESESSYFENLVFFNQSKTDEEREFYRKNLNFILSHQERTLLTNEQYQIFSKWYPLAIHEMVQLKDFQAKPKWIASRLDYEITPEEAKAALELLIKLKLIEVDPKTKKARVTQQSLETPNEVLSRAAVDYHKQASDLARKAVEFQSAKERCFSSLTIAVNSKDLAKVFKKIHEFRNEIDSLL